MASRSRQSVIRELTPLGLLTLGLPTLGYLAISLDSPDPAHCVGRRGAGAGIGTKLRPVVLRRPPVYRLQISRPAFRTVALRVSCSVIDVKSA